MSNIPLSQTKLSALDRLTTLGEEVERMMAEMKVAAQEAVKDGTKGIFEEYGDILHSFGWTQYTPYFNDGDPCVFGMGELSLVAKVDMEEAKEEAADEYELDDIMSEWVYEGSPKFSPYGGEGSYVDEEIGYGENAKPNPSLDQRYVDCLDACKKVYNILGSADQRLALDLFGDHVRVIFTKDGVDVEDHEHE